MRLAILCLCFASCSTWWIDKINGLPDDNRINRESERAAIDPPSRESPYWRQYYDPELTKALNER